MPQAPATPSTGPQLPKLSIAPTPVPKVSVSADVDPGAITDGLGDTVETILPDVDPGEPAALTRPHVG